MNNQKNFKLIKEEQFYMPWGKVWTHGSDVMATSKRHGFVPPSEIRNDYLFKIKRKQTK